jgi:restriction endonuclease S subunit
MNNTTLQTFQVAFSDFINWNPYQIVEFETAKNALNPTFQRIKIGDFVTVKKRKLKLENHQNYQRITTQLYQKGIVLRDAVNGKNIKTKTQFIVQTGDIVISKINARKGGFGIIPKALNEAIVSSDYIVLNVDENIILKDFFILILDSEWFLNRLKEVSQGTVFQRIKVQLFLNLEIPIPSIDQQKKIVHTYQKIIKTVENCENEYNDLIEQSTNFIHNQLKIIEQKIDFSKGEIVHYANFHTWDIWNFVNDFRSENYETVTLEQLLIEKPKYGSNQAVATTFDDVRYVRISDIDDWNTLKETALSPQNFEARFLLKHNDFLLARSGSVGKALLYKSEMGKAAFAGYLIRFRVNEALINPDYLIFYTQTNVFQTWINQNKSGIAIQNINAATFLKAPIILPPLAIQNEIANFWNTTRQQAIELKTTAKTEQIAATNYFNQILFK